MAGGVVAEPLNPRDGFNWVFLVELLICGILTIFFFFYFNRLVATLISYAVRAYTWRNFHAYIDITGLQISPLGGRIFFKDIRYHGHNETILVHGGYITWNYWLRRVRDAAVYTEADSPVDDDDGTSSSSNNDDPTPSPSASTSRSRNVDRAEKGGKQTPKQLPCRISVKVSGVEAFMYNRSPAYDAIIEAFERKACTNDAKATSTNDTRNASDSNFDDASLDDEHHHSKLKKEPSAQGRSPLRVETSHSTASRPKKDSLPSFLKILPVYVDIAKGAIVVGNENTLAVITAQFEKATGTLDAASSGPLDVYQQLFSFQVTHPVVHMKPNPDYKATQLDTAAQYKQEAGKGTVEEQIVEKGVAQKRRRPWSMKVPFLSVLFSRSSDSVHAYSKAGMKDSKHFTPQWHFPGQERWKGLARYLDDSQNDGHGEWDGIEYAKTSLIADIPCVNVSFYWDVTGPVPTAIDNSMFLDPSRPHDINGSIPPDYGMDIEIFGGIINYGPWADRHRGVFQNFYFPGARVDALPAKPLTAGDPRTLSIFKLFLFIREDTVLRIPVREPSKDWKWKGKAHTLAAHEKSANANSEKAKSRRRRGKQRDNTAGQNVRPFAWIDVKVAGDSTVNYTMDMVASSKGFGNKLDVSIKSTEISSSVNHGLLWRSGSIALDCDLSAPLAWNTLRTWMFNVKCQDLELFLLRDHLFLLTDLVADWGAGPPPDYFVFVPFRYLLHVDFSNFKLYMNTNDSNIVNNPADLDDNNFIILSGQHLYGDVTIPLDKFRPLQNEIQFDVRGKDMGLEVLMPSKNTLNTFLKSSKVAKLGCLTLTGSHTYVTTTDAMNTDRLYMDIQGQRLTLELYGWLIHHFMKIKDNYFGDDLHFKTLEEFQGLPSTGFLKDGPEAEQQPAKVSNDLDVILCISVDAASVLVPSNLYSAERCIRADLPYASADLRFTNYYMDLMVNFSPISIGLSEPPASAESSPEAHAHSSGQTEVFIDSIVIFGHRLFGLPPTEPTYICNWDFDVGRLAGECTPSFIETAAGAVRSFAFTLDDDENSLPLTEIAPIHDATLLRLRTKDVHLWLHVAPEAFLIKTSAITLDFNDLAGTTFSQRLSACVPDLTLAAVDARSASRLRTRAGEKQTVETHAFFHTTLSLNMLKRDLNFTASRGKQQSHMREHDQRTNRAKFMFKHEFDDTFHRTTTVQADVRPPAMQFPDIPQPILYYGPRTNETYSMKSTVSMTSGSFQRGRRPGSNSVRSMSHGSLAGSIRSTLRHKHTPNTAGSSRSRTLLDGSSNRDQSYVRYHSAQDEQERARRNLAPSSVALSSSLAPPYFPLDQVDPDLSDVPSIPTLPPEPKDKRDSLIFNDVSTGYLDENFSHTSLLISAEPGIRIYCTPAFVKCVSNLVEIIRPQRPEDLLDDFQVSVMSKILANRARLEGIGSSLEFNIRVPFAHVRFQHAFDASASSVGGKDQYDVIANQLNLAARIKKFPGERAGEDSLALHSTLGSLGLSVTECAAQGPSEDVAVQAELRDVLVWSLQNKESSVNVTFRSFEVAAASEKIEYLASLVHRTTMLTDDLASGFVNADEQHDNRLRYLAWYLTNVQDQYADPAFLTKASYALRAARDHLRSHDSWKIISRFRYTWQCLPSYEKRDLTRKCAQQSVGCPDNAEDAIIAMWDQWRTWDLAHVEKSLAMKLLFGHLTDSLPTPDSAPLYLNLKSGNVKMIVDPGPKQSEVEVGILGINVALLPPVKEPDALGVMTVETPTKSSTVQVSAKETLVHVHWEICELAEALTKLFTKADTASDMTALKKVAHQRHEKKTSHHQNIQVVLTTHKSQIILDTLNLRTVMTGQRMQFSFVDVDTKAFGLGETLSAHIHLELAVGEIFARSRSLAKVQFEQPSLYFALVEHEKGSKIPDEIKVAAASQMIVVKVQEDILGIVDVADLVLREEVAYFARHLPAMQALGKSKMDKGQTKVNKPNDDQLPNVTLALFMEAYQVELALLSPLGWAVSGKSGRIAVVPTLGKNVTLRVDYDVDASHHRLYSISDEGSHVISSLQLPAVNGRLDISQYDQETRITASGIVDTIQIQAAEVQALATTLNKPEVTHTLDAIKDDVGVLKSHINDIFTSKETGPAKKPLADSKEILFGVQLTLSGMDITATAPGKDLDSSTARLAFHLSTVQLKATNIDSNDKAMVFPEAVIRIHEVSIDLTLSHSESIRRCGNLTFSAILQATTEQESDPKRRLYRIQSSGLELNVFADTASAVVDVMNHLQDRIKDLDLSKEKKYLKRLRRTKSKLSSKRAKSIQSRADTDNASTDSGALFTSTYSVELLDLQAAWIVGTSVAEFANSENENLVLSFKRINLSTQKDDAARLMIEDTQLQMVPRSANKKTRSLNSALLPKMQFHVAYASTRETRKLAFHAAGKALDLQLDSKFIMPANVLERSIALAGRKFRRASANWSVTPTTSGAQRKNPFGNKRLSSLTVDANFAGAVVHINGREGPATQGASHRSQQKGRYSQFVGDGSKSSLALRAPGIALRVEYQDEGQDPSVNVELRVDGSSNTMLPTVVPIIIDISDSIKAVVRDKDSDDSDSPQNDTAELQAKPATKLLDDDNNIINADPSALLGRTSLNLGLRICKQEFSLSCQPIARVAAIAKLDDIYVTVNSVKSQEHGHFFAASAAFTKLNATVQHVYSRESTFGLDVDSIVLSLMNSKHLSGTSGISAILKINPTALQINARQLQDFLLFREIWIPPEIRQASQPADANVNPDPEPQEYLMQRYQQVTAATAFPWNANVAFTDVKVDLDLGQAIGKSSLHIHNMWASSTKGTDWEQNLCIGIEKVSLESTGRTSGFVELAGMKVRTSIRWPERSSDTRLSPLIQASIGFKQLRVKSGFDYQAFAVADIANFEFLMYNVRGDEESSQDRLVAILDGDKVHVFCHSRSAAEGLALYQAIERLVQENHQAYMQSLKDIEKYLRRKSSVAQSFGRSPSQSMIAAKKDGEDAFKAPISLHTDVVVTLRSVNLGVYPGTFLDNLVLMLEAGDMQARFAVALESSKIHSSLGMTLGQLSVALSSVPTPKKTKAISDLTVEDVVEGARSARGGTILRVPKVIATMHTWQVPKENQIDYVFRSSLEGKVDVGWNYSRISHIRQMWTNHSRTLAQRLGKPLPESNIKISTSQTLDVPGDIADSKTDKTTAANTAANTPPARQRALSVSTSSNPDNPSSEQEKITAVVNVPQSKYEYTPLEPPIIDTPQLRDMGEATPPLEWIGLHRDRLPNVTHQIVIVALLEVAREVEDAYERILGSS